MSNNCAQKDDITEVDPSEFLKLLLERQAAPMNTEDDMPEWLKAEKSREQAGNNASFSTEGQAHVFQGGVFDENQAGSEVPGASAADPNTTLSSHPIGDPTNTAGWNWRENVRPDQQRSLSAKRESAQASFLQQVNEGDDVVLLDLFQSLQAERVAVYRDFELTFQQLLQHNRIQDYALLCTEVTQSFSQISQNILAVKRAFTRRGAGTKAQSPVDISEVIGKIQAQEQEKLAVVAALHLDKIREKFPGMGGSLAKQGQQAMKSHTVGRPVEHVNESGYYRKRVREIEAKVGELLEEVAELKCELMLG